MRVLFVEDDVLLGQALAAGLRQLGHAADWFTNGKDADGALLAAPYDALVLDLGLPGGDGLVWLRRWRDRGLALPVLVLTARELALLEALMLDPQRVLSKSLLREKLYDWSEAEPEGNSLEVHIHHLRRKIDPGIVRTVRGVGYALGTPEAAP